jgi:hypothetical protein
LEPTVSWHLIGKVPTSLTANIELRAIMEPMGTAFIVGAFHTVDAKAAAFPTATAETCTTRAFIGVLKIALAHAFRYG